MSEIIFAPWTEQQVQALNEFQNCRMVHPFTCGSGDRTDAKHSAYQAEHGGDFGQLVATVNAWICPSCDYTQDWAHSSMTDPAFLKASSELWEKMYKTNPELGKLAGFEEES